MYIIRTKLSKWYEPPNGEVVTKTQKTTLLDYYRKMKSFGFSYENQSILDQLGSQKEGSSLVVPTTQSIDACTLCDGAKVTRNKISIVGKLDADLLFVPVSPQFSSQAQEMLENMIQKVLKIDSSRYAIASIVKCDIAHTHPNIEKFAAICKGYLMEQLSLEKKGVIVTLGESYKYLLGESKPLSVIRGNSFSLGQKVVIPIYHPEFLLRNPSSKKETMIDLKKIALLLEHTA